MPRVSSLTLNLKMWNLKMIPQLFNLKLIDWQRTHIIISKFYPVLFFISSSLQKSRTLKNLHKMCRKLFSAINFQTLFFSLVFVCWFCGTPNIIKMTVFPPPLDSPTLYIIHFQFDGVEKRFALFIVYWR